MKHTFSFLSKRKLNRYILLCILQLSTWTLLAQSPSATDIANQMTIGWNQGNSLEVPDGETAWGNAPASQQLIDGVKAAGFNTIRLPCAWNSYANQSTYEIDPNWLARIKEVVDYCYNNDMFVIINSHWDGGWLEEHPFYANQAEVNAKQEAYWTQVANYFADYDEHLLFAGTNEVRADYGTPTAEHIDVQESYNQTFIDAVRATGGGNLNRILIAQTYNTNIWHGLDYFTLPNDPVDDKLMVEVHNYDSYEFTILEDSNACPQWDTGNCSWANASYIQDMFSRVKERWVDNGIPVIVGEYGARKKPSGDDAERIEYLEFTTNAMKQNGMIPIYWDNGYATEFGLFDRSTGIVFDQPGLDALMAGAGVTPGTSYTLTTNTNGSGSISVSPNNDSYQSGTQVTLTATTTSDYVFTGWSGDASGSANPLTITMSSNKSVTANFIEKTGSGGTGTILREVWLDSGGTAISDLTSNSNYPNTPDSSEQITSLEGPTNDGDAYGARVRGYIHPLVSGNYTFWVAGDDNVDLLLSTDDTASNTSRIAYVEGWTNSREWGKYSSQQSTTIALVAGQKYYIEVLHKEGYGGDNLAVAWEGPGISRAVIDGEYLSPYSGTTNPTVDVTGVSVSSTSLSLGEGNTATIVATVSPSNATNTSVSWSSSDTNVATVNNSGVVTAIGEGTATITVTTADGGFTATTSVSVTSSSVPVTGVSVSPTTLTLDEGNSTTLIATVSPSNATNTSVSWSSSNTNVATVNNSGVVTAISEGTATITVTTADGDFTATTSVTVNSNDSGTPCDNPTIVSLPFSYDGTGTFCWEVSGTINYINSWNTASIKINGVDYTNTWSNNMPATINGKYYIEFEGNLDWSHFEITGSSNNTSSKTTSSEVSTTLNLFPNPSKGSFQIIDTSLKGKVKVDIYATNGSLVYQQERLSSNAALNINTSLEAGIYFLVITNNNKTLTNKLIIK